MACPRDLKEALGTGHEVKATIKLSKFIGKRRKFVKLGLKANDADELVYRDSSTFLKVFISNNT